MQTNIAEQTLLSTKINS